MSGMDDAAITEAVLQRFEATPDPRLKQLIQALVRHSHAFVRETEPTFEEWQAAIGFLTRTGHTCDDKRQEFILLSDTLGISMLVDAINHRFPSGATETTVLGPFYVEQAPLFPNGANLAEGLAGDPLYVDGRVTSHTGAPLADALVEIWHSDSGGFYDVQLSGGTAARGNLKTDSEGRFSFWTIRPTSYPIPDDGPVGAMLKATNRHPYRPAHIHFMISAPGFRKLVTHIFVKGDPYLSSDAVFGVKDSLVQDFESRPADVKAPDGSLPGKPWYHLNQDFALAKS